MLLSGLASPGGTGTRAEDRAGAGAGGGSAGGAGIPADADADPESGPEARTAAAVTRTGRDWGRYLVEQLPPSHTPTAEDTVARLTAMLDDLGFAPEPAGSGPVPDRIRLRHCPFLELAEEYGKIVCPLHLGLMQGALDELRAPVAATRLEPFAEPGACLAHLAPAARRAEPAAPAAAHSPARHLRGSGHPRTTPRPSNEETTQR
jgi:hypothetical protein